MKRASSAPPRSKKRKNSELQPIGEAAKQAYLMNILRATVLIRPVIPWPCKFPVPTREQEQLLVGSCNLFFKNDPLLFEELPALRKQQILSAAESSKIHPQQAISLRSQLLHSAAPYRFNGTESASLEAANELESEVATFLSSCGVSFLTQDHQQSHIQSTISHHLDRQGIPTPDFVIPGGVIIHGQRVFWIEVKRFYGTGVPTMKKWMPVYRVPKQTLKYIECFGAGALLFISGYAQALAESVPECVVMLDATPFHDFSSD